MDWPSFFAGIFVTFCVIWPLGFYAGALIRAHRWEPQSVSEALKVLADYERKESAKRKRNGRAG